MSENLELVRSIYAGWEQGDYSSLKWAHPELEWDFAADGPAPRGGTGLAGMADGWREVISAFDEVRNVAEEFLELDDERVLVLQHLSGHGKTSGLDLDQVQQGAVLFQIREGKVTRLVGYVERAAALADLSLGR